VLHRWRAGGTPCPSIPSACPNFKSFVFFVRLDDSYSRLFQTSGNATLRCIWRGRVSWEQSARTSSLALRLTSCSTTAIISREFAPGVGRIGS
jgi:hypothetical protein